MDFTFGIIHRQPQSGVRDPIRGRANKANTIRASESGDHFVGSENANS